jgi:asparagine synthase (glutamine-hydrolysing)
LPTYYVSKIARERVTVALSGDGGDENFAGYGRYVSNAAENRIRRFLPPWLRKTIFGPLAMLCPELGCTPRFSRARSTFQRLPLDPLEGYFERISIFRHGDKKKILSPDFISRLQGYSTRDLFHFYYNKAGTDDSTARIQYLDIKTFQTRYPPCGSDEHGSFFEVRCLPGS